MPTDYSQNGKAQNERFLARELDAETEDARVGDVPWDEYWTGADADEGTEEPDSIVIDYPRWLGDTTLVEMRRTVSDAVFAKTGLRVPGDFITYPAGKLTVFLDA